ncbi:MAG: hypothetical protein SVZ03_03750 [Spirochaetota bacterium]|nr:hypothetical protein [Spirochaetota bacterium]
MDTNIKELTIRDVANIIFRHKFVIILTFCIIMSGVFIGMQTQTPVYEARVKMLIKGQSQTLADTYRGIGAFRIHLTQTEIVKSNPVIKRAVKALKIDERPLDYELNFCSRFKKPLIRHRVQSIKREFEQLSPKEQKEFFFKRAVGYLKQNLQTEYIANTDIFIIIVRDLSPEGAVAIANVISRSYSIFDQMQQLAELKHRYGNLHPSVIQLKNNIQRMNDMLSGEPIDDLEAIGTASVKIIEQATTNSLPIGRPKRLVLMIGLFISTILGVASAIVFDYIDQTFRSPNDIVTFLRLPLLGSIPARRFREDALLKKEKASTRYAYFYEELTDQIYIFMKVQNLKTLIITSPVHNLVNTTIVPNLGYCFSQMMQHKTLIVDANLRCPILHTVLGLAESPGLSEVINNNDPTKHIEEIDINLNVLQAGDNTLESVTIRNKLNLNEVFQKIKDKYEAILIDCSNTKYFNDINILSQNVDGVLIVVNEKKDRRQVAQSFINRLRNNNVNVIGVIMNNRRFKIPEIIYKRL